MSEPDIYDRYIEAFHRGNEHADEIKRLTAELAAARGEVERLRAERDEKRAEAERWERGVMLIRDEATSTQNISNEYQRRWLDMMRERDGIPELIAAFIERLADMRQAAQLYHSNLRDLAADIRSGSWRKETR